MFIQCAVVGIDHWHDLTMPFIMDLHENNKNMNIVVVDNCSNEKYPVPVGRNLSMEIWRLNHRLGYGAALNLVSLSMPWDWFLCCNNDCICDGNVEDIIKNLRDDTIYGNAWKLDYSGMEKGLPAVVDSAYLLIPRKVWEVVGMFDPKMDAAFEEIDLQIRALDAGFRVDVVDLPITHLNMHTRRELKGYDERWRETEKYFLSKHPGRK